jgi:hypothetical protein
LGGVLLFWKRLNKSFLFSKGLLKCRTSKVNLQDASSAFPLIWPIRLNFTHWWRLFFRHAREPPSTKLYKPERLLNQEQSDLLVPLMLDSP